MKTQSNPSKQQKMSSNLFHSTKIGKDSMNEEVQEDKEDKKITKPNIQTDLMNILYTVPP